MCARERSGTLLLDVLSETEYSMLISRAEKGSQKNPSAVNFNYGYVGELSLVLF